MALFSRNNFGPIQVLIRPDTFQGKRQYKKFLKKVLGRGYPMDLAETITRISRNRGNPGKYFMVNDRACKIIENNPNNGYKSDNLKYDQYYRQKRSEQGISLEKQCWEFMKHQHTDLFKMKEPK